MASQKYVVAETMSRRRVWRANSPPLSKVIDPRRAGANRLTMAIRAEMVSAAVLDHRAAYQGPADFALMQH